MGAEGESAEQAAAARRERLRALRAAKELLSTPDGDAAPAAANASESGVLPPKEVVDQDVRDVALEEPDGNRLISDEGTAVDVVSEQENGIKEEKGLPNSPDLIETGVSVEDTEDVEEEKKINVKFRNYVPLDKRLQEHKLAPPSLPKFEDLATTATEPEKTEDPFVNIAPKKPNWDLRRDVQKRLDKLERRTQKALYELYVEQEERQALEGGDQLGPEKQDTFIDP